MGTILVLATAFCFALVSLAQAGALQSSDKAWMKKNFKNKDRTVNIPIWGITQNGTCWSVNWQDHAPNPRFAIYDNGTPEDETDDLVLDKETGLVWERSPSTTTMSWDNAIYYCHNNYPGARKGWRLPTAEELASLVDMNTPDYLPDGHPFIGVQSSSTFYWSSTTRADDTSKACDVGFSNGHVGGSYKTHPDYVWCVRGGQGHDGW